MGFKEFPLTFFVLFFLVPFLSMFILSFFFWFDLGIGLVGVLLFYFLTHFLHVVGLLSFFFYWLLSIRYRGSV